MKKTLLLAALICGIGLSTQASPKPLKRNREYLKVMESRLSDEDRYFLRNIHEPVAVGVPPCNARAYICIMPDGEIRSYGKKFNGVRDREGTPVYLSSVDCGLSWKEHLDKGAMGPATWFPEAGVWLKFRNSWNGSGSLLLRSAKGPEDPEPEIVDIDLKDYFDGFLPQKLDSRDRWYFTCQTYVDGVNCAAFVYSDDKCRSFKVSLVPQPKWTTPEYPHKGSRWCICSGCEPYVCQIDAHTLMMILRTPADNFYQCFSTDWGTSWSEPEPSPFHGTNTTAFLLPLSDGRILAFWNNTRPLPELDHYSQEGVGEGVAAGYDEDFFTNRDAAHVAVSNDCGRSWIGARELCLNAIRNNADYRYVGNPYDSRDKSVHQFQAFELPFGKVLVVAGQNEAARKMFIFDPDWLYETQRHEDFFGGLGNVSTQVYVKSYASYTPENGHCSYNRTNGAVKAVDPLWSRDEVVQISRIDDPRLLNGRQGLVWNFPAARKGSVKAVMYIAEGSADISLDDCWSNPCDEFEAEQALFSFHIGKEMLEGEKYHEIEIRYNLDVSEAELFIDGRAAGKKHLGRPFCIGASYISIQCAAEGPCKGIFLKSLDAQEIAATSTDSTKKQP